MREILWKETGVVYGPCLNLSDKLMTREEMTVLCNELKQNNGFSTLILSRNYFGNSGAKLLGEMLKYNTSLTYINIRLNDIGGDEGAIAISEGLKMNYSLTSLNMDSNYIHNVGAKALGDALKNNNTLTDLYIPYNVIGNEGAEILVNSLKYNDSIIRLTMTHNNIDFIRNGPRTIGYGVDKNQKRIIDVTGYPIKYSNNVNGMKAIWNAIRYIRKRRLNKRKRYVHSIAFILFNSSEITLPLEMVHWILRFVMDDVPKTLLHVEL